MKIQKNLKKFCETVDCILNEKQLIISNSYTETQRAECTIISGDVRATAEATISHKLEGFCATGEFEI